MSISQNVKSVVVPFSNHTHPKCLVNRLMSIPNKVATQFIVSVTTVKRADKLNSSDEIKHGLDHICQFEQCELKI